LAAASQFDGAVIPLVNGVDGTAVVEAAVGALRTIGGLCRMVSEIESPGVIRHWAVPPSVHCGELDGCRSDRIIEIASDLERSGVTTEVSTNIIGAIWAKAAFISSWGTFCAAARAPIGEVRQTALGQTVLRCAVEEILAVGAAAGVTLPQECAATVFAEIMALQAGATSSLQRDMDAGRQSELDWQLGRLLTKAPVHGVAVPTLSAAYAILHIRERTNAELRVGETGPPPQRMLTRPGIGD
ncbi:MAG: ketopantoate reductase C-terminal domain-containing protein, partial [Phycisphaerae bacterium]|nr:ketopantoate reductase C-terminal domain-containing protein [Phycisphaerae bacterium]